MIIVQTMREIPGKDAVLAVTALLVVLSLVWTARFNRLFLGGRFDIPPSWMPTMFRRAPRFLRSVACWWILFFSSPVLLLLAVLAAPFGVRMFPVFMPRWLTNASAARPWSAWADINLVKIPIGIFFVIIDVSMIKLTFSAILDESVFYCSALTIFWLFFTLSAARIGGRHFLHHPSSYLGMSTTYDDHAPY